MLEGLVALRRCGLARPDETLQPIDSHYTAVLTPAAGGQVRLILFHRKQLVYTARCADEGAALDVAYERASRQMPALPQWKALVYVG